MQYGDVIEYDSDGNLVESEAGEKQGDDKSVTQKITTWLLGEEK